MNLQDFLASSKISYNGKICYSKEQYIEDKEKIKVNENDVVELIKEHI